MLSLILSHGCGVVLKVVGLPVVTLCVIYVIGAGARNYSQCDSMLIGDQAGANTYPYIQVSNTANNGAACL
jgi:hypothetical protein